MATDATAAAAATGEEGTAAAGPEWTTDRIRNAMVIAGTTTDPADPAVRMEHDSPEAAATAAADMTATITAVAAEAAAEGGRGPNGPLIPIKDPGFSTRYPVPCRFTA
jgi:hypothetical protein